MIFGNLVKKEEDGLFFNTQLAIDLNVLFSSINEELT
jgi:hypothetical protein